MSGAQFPQSSQSPTAGQSSLPSYFADNTNEVELPSYNDSQTLFPHRPTNGDRKEPPEPEQPTAAAPEVPSCTEEQHPARTPWRSRSLVEKWIFLCRIFALVVLLATMPVIVIYSLQVLEHGHGHEHKEAQNVRGPVSWSPTTTMNHTLSDGATMNSTLVNTSAILNGTGTERRMEAFMTANSNDTATEEDRATSSDLRMVLLLEDIFANLKQDLEAKRVEEPRQRRMVKFVA